MPDNNKILYIQNTALCAPICSYMSYIWPIGSYISSVYYMLLFEISLSVNSFKDDIEILIICF